MKSSSSRSAATVTRQHHEAWSTLLVKAASVGPLTTAVVYPRDATAIAATAAAASAGIIDPILVGPLDAIAEAAGAAGCDISAFPVIDVPDPRTASAAAVAEAVARRCGALMKGSLHTDELLHAVVREPRLRTSRRISHAYLIDLPSYAEPFILTDTVVNVAPDLEEKADIVRNAIALAQAIGMCEPRVAILSAVEMVTSEIPSTIDAAALSKMADRGQITRALVDGPLALDDAISPRAAQMKGIVSRVAGRANILVVPDLDAGNMVAKELEFLSHAHAAGVVLGAKVPVVLTSRAETVRTRVASCALAVLYADSHHA